MPHVSTTEPVRAPVADSITLVSVPASHPYVRHLLPTDGSAPAVDLRPDPDPDDWSRPAGDRWWPPAALDPAWVRSHDFDLLHLHFGYDGFSPAELAAFADALAGTGRPFVLTLHDLRNPHHDDPGLLPQQLDVLVPAAAAVLTLTDAAASVIAGRWGRRATVVPHPHVVDLDAMAALRAGRRAAPAPVPVVGLAVKELRRNVDPLRLLPGLLAAVREHPDARLRVTAQRDLRERDDDRTREVVAVLDALAADPRVDVAWHDRWSDEELWAELAGQAVAVLPYRFGTHSGWLEACHDVGTRVLAPTLGCYADQGADATYDASETAVDEQSLVAGVRGLLAQATAPGADLVGREPEARRRQQHEVATTVRRLYLEVLSEPGRRR